MLVGSTFVSAAEDEDLHQAVEDERVADPRAVAVQRVLGLAHGQQREELVAGPGRECMTGQQARIPR